MMGMFLYFVFTLLCSVFLALCLIKTFRAAGATLAKRSMLQTILICLGIPILFLLFGFVIVAAGNALGGSGPEYGPGYGIGETIIVVSSFLAGVLISLLLLLSRKSPWWATVSATLLASWAWTELGIELFKLLGLIVPNAVKLALFGVPYMDTSRSSPFIQWLAAILAAVVCLITARRVSGQPLFGRLSSRHGEVSEVDSNQPSNPG